VKLYVPADYDSLQKKMLAEEVHLGQMSAYLYKRGAFERVRKGVQTYVLAQERRSHEVPHAGALIVGEKSKLKSIKGIKGKRLAYVDEQSSSGFYYPRQLMKAQGIDPDKDLGAQMLAGTHNDVVKKVVAGEVDVGCVSLETAGSAKGIRVLAKTDPIPDDAVVSLGGLSEAERVKVRELLVQAHQSPALKPLLAARGIEKYVEPDLTVYLPPKQ
jgi:phosphonate transport system substrate-binding protein